MLYGSVEGSSQTFCSFCVMSVPLLSRDFHFLPQTQQLLTVNVRHFYATQVHSCFSPVTGYVPTLFMGLSRDKLCLNILEANLHHNSN